jgi:6-carboxyhexanoate--CoA ligase
MRASKKRSAKTSGHNSVDEKTEIHISGAEGIFEASEISKVSRKLIDRAFSHPRGKPDKIIITIDEIRESPSRASLLPVKTLKCSSPEDAWSLIVARLLEIGVSSRATQAAFRVLRSDRTMRGAALISAQTGRRREPDRIRGLRVSRLGIDKISEKKLARRLSRLHLNNPTVKEALILASKVASCKDILAEVCFSDDPDYTTGYLASRSLGYLRVTNVKRRGEMHGGRVFFVNENSSTDGIIDWLEKKPVIIEYSHE